MGFTFLVLLAIGFLAYRWFNKQGSPIGVAGDLVYADQGRNSTLFVSDRYGIKAKPDFIIRLPNGNNAIAEYKSRSNNVYQSDIVQVKASALAVRAHMPLQQAFVVLKNRRQEIPLPKDDEELYREIECHVKWAREIKTQKALIMVGCKNRNQCNNCSIRHNCQINRGV